MNHRLRPFLAILVLGLVAPICVGAEKNADFLRGDAIYQHGNGNPAEFPQALASFKIAAAAGHANSQFLVGRMYHLGHGVAVDPAQAEHWYRMAGKNGSAFAWNNLANVYGALGRKEEEILNCYMRSLELGNAMGSFNMAQALRVGLFGIRQNHVRALEYYRKTLDLQPDYPEVWRSMGIIYEYGDFGVEKDLNAAEDAYLNEVRVSEDKFSYYNLYRLYWNGLLPATHGPATEFLEKAAEHGHALAALRVGESYRLGWWGKPDLVKAVHFLDIAARGNCGWCIQFLGEHAKDKRLVEAYGEQVANGWKTRFADFQKAGRKEAEGDLIGVKSAFSTGDEAAAEAALDAALKRWKARTVDDYFQDQAITLWYDAQLKAGREDPEWGRFIFAWLARVYESDKHCWNVPAARINLDEQLIETGRYGLLRESCAEVKKLLREMEGIDFDAVRAKVKVGTDHGIIGAEHMPLVVDVGEALRSRRVEYYTEPSRGEPIGGQAMGVMRDLAAERLSVGDWESVLVVAEWLERWVHKVKSTGKQAPRDYPGCLLELEQISWALKAEAFAALGLPEKEAAAWQPIIGLNYRNSYGGQQLHKARHRLAGILVDQGRTGEVDLEALRQVEDQMRQNRFEDGGEWLYAKLVRARVLSGIGQSDAGIALANEVLGASAEKKRPVIRLESLLVAAGLELDAGKTEGVAAYLKEALTWARAKGLLLQELRIYQVYVRYLIAIGDYDQALEMQRRVLGLIEALKLTPRLERANLRLAEIYGLRNEAAAARSLLAKIKDPALGGEVKSLAESLKGGENKPAGKAGAVPEPIDLQPLGIQSMPMRDEAEAVFILTNPNPGACIVEVEFHSGSFGLVVERATPDEILLRCETAAGEGKPDATVKFEVPGGRQVPVSLTARGPGTSGADAKVSLRARIAAGRTWRESEWRILADAEKTLVAVVDAARLRNDPFYLVPVYHHLHAAQDQAASVALRVVASEPTRVEGFAADGTLLFVDAEGNGSFGDPGDLLATADVRDLFPMLGTGEKRDRIALRYAPRSGCANGRVEIRIETQVTGGDGTWKTDAVDWLEP